MDQLAELSFHRSTVRIHVIGNLKRYRGREKMGHPRPLFRLFLSFQTNITIIRTNNCEKVMTTSAGIQTHDLRNMSLLP